MRQLIKIWLVLFVAHLLSRTAISLIAFQNLDLRFEVFAQVILVPTVQALALWWFVYEVRPQSSVTTLKASVARQPLLAVFLLVDCVVLLLGWFIQSQSWSDFANPRSMPSLYAGAKALAGGLLMIMVTLQRPWTSGERLWCFLFGAGLALYGSDYFFHGLSRMPDLFFPNLPLLWRWILVYGTLFVLAIAALLKIESIWTRRSLASATFLNWAVGFALLSAMIVVLGSYNLPYLLAPWSTLAKNCSFLVLTAIWSGVLDARVSAQSLESRKPASARKTKAKGDLPGRKKEIGNQPSGSKHATGRSH